MPPTLEPEELKALMGAVRDGTVATGTPSPRRAVVPWDLTSRDRVIRGQMPTLDAVNERVASLFASGLSGRTRLDLRVVSSPATLLKFAEFQLMLRAPATIGVLDLSGGRGQALLVLEPGVADALLAAALGDRRAQAELAPAEGRRDLTAVEKLVLRRLLSVLADAMRTGWADVMAMEPQVVGVESDARLAGAAPPSEVVVLATFELSGGLSGRLHLGIPLATLEPVRKQLASQPRLVEGGDERFGARLALELAQVRVDVTALLGRTRLSVSRVLALAPGDVLALDGAEGEPVPVLVQRREKLRGRPRVSGGSIAVVLEAGLAQPAPLRRSAA